MTALGIVMMIVGAAVFVVFSCKRGRPTPLGLLNFVVLQWFGVRLARSFRMVHDIPPGEFAGALESTLYNVMAKCYGVDEIGPPPKSYPMKSYPMKHVPHGWRLQRWIWPLTGWWSAYRFVARPSPLVARWISIVWFAVGLVAVIAGEVTYGWQVAPIMHLWHAAGYVVFMSWLVCSRWLQP